MDIEQTIIDIEDNLFPRLNLDSLERVLYYFLFRNTRLTGKDSDIFAISFLSRGTGLSEVSVRDRIRSIHKKGCIEIQNRGKRGHLVKVLLPNEIPGVIPAPSKNIEIDIENIDFYTDRKYIGAIIKREEGKCFYCLKKINVATCVLDHLVPQMVEQNNSYRNIVGCCHECNATKQGQDASDFIRALYRQGALSQIELQDRIENLEKLVSGQLKPDIRDT